MISSKFSVLIPYYNSKDTIKRSVQSALIQDFVGEILIYNDGSDAESSDYLNFIQSLDTKIKIYNSEANWGAGFARKFLIKNSNMEFIAFLDADDEWLPNKLNMQKKIFDSSPNALIVSTAYHLVNVNKSKVITAPNEIYFKDLLNCNWIGNSTAALRRSDGLKVDYPQIRRRQDYAFWLSILEIDKKKYAKCIQEPLVKYHVLKDSLSSSYLKNIKFNFIVFYNHMNFTFPHSFYIVIKNIYYRLLK